jgi:poly(3-hydroxyalkanoate) synthetase
VHKIDIILLGDTDQAFNIKVLKNGEKVYEKVFHIHHKAKSLFPNIKIPVKMSDVFAVLIEHQALYVREVKFIVDSIKRGKTSNYEVWLRNARKTKVGDLKLEYFLENLYLENERQIFIRNGIYPSKPLLLIGDSQ